MFTPFAFVKSAAAAAPVLWTPSQITTLAWYDASNASSITLNGSNVSQMNDLSGNGYNAFQNTSANQPLYSGSIGGLNTITFNPSGTNEKLDLPSIAIPGNYRMTFYLVAQMTSRLTSYSVAFLPWETGTRAVGMLTALPGAGNWCLHTGGDVQSNVKLDTNPYFLTAATKDDNVPYVVFSTNGVLFNYLGSNPFNGSSVFSSGGIGNDQYGSAFSGYWGEAVLVGDFPTTEAREKMEGYLAWKWGLQANLPITSPYYNAPPYV
jgi:hypothetical protein